MTVGEARPHIRAASTEMLAEAEQFSFFCDAICGTYTGIRPERPDHPAFPARYAAAQFGDLAFASIEAPGHHARRDRAMLARQPDDSLFLNCSPWHGYNAHIAGDAMEVGAGLPLLLANDDPFTVTFPTTRMTLLTLRLPRQMVSGASRGELTSLNSRISRTSAGRLIAQQMRMLGEVFSSGDVASAALMARSVVSLLQHMTGEPDAGSGTPMLRLMKQYAESRMQDSGFGISDLARQFGCTPRTVQNHFASERESFSQWLLDRRLERARLLLENPASQKQTVATIAHACGFADAAHFHRRFRERYGAPPGYFRP